MKKRSSGRKKLKRATGRKRRPKLELARAYRLVPVKISGVRSPHEHVRGAAGIPPCPPGSTFVDKVILGGVTYCMYRDAHGMMFLIVC